MMVLVEIIQVVIILMRDQIVLLNTSVCVCYLISVPGVSSSYQYHRELAISGALFNLIQVCVCGIGILFNNTI